MTRESSKSRLWRARRAAVTACVGAIVVVLGWGCAGDPSKGDAKPQGAEMISPDRSPGAVKAKPAGVGAQSVEGVPLTELFHVWQLLMAIDSMPDAAQFRQAASDPTAALWVLCHRDDITPSTRQRAFEALSLVPDERVKSLYEATMDDPEADRLRHSAINGYARAWPAEAPARLGPLLTDDEDPQIRLTAGSALHTFCGAQGAALIAKAVKTEPEGWVRDKLKSYGAPSRGGALPPGLR